ncbi:poly(R)-hydroxyalkanoic acid synthase subunit PhaE [Marinisporobacter balticus]|uniref:Poly(3-hydroxyalkanoate) polymerase subunit PhaE n=1 Tax=Marinisporobacter balticus TaxID=2018667 RepID=A0A4R2KYJ9_9FIRM|nr:poly(R)-hydroxyalkanoic acid synthase subunit PhaE [Marinisporobacter balticus]TCO77977.1 class III poly(R)-hydroxyalkanoic acid synthase PhaE subunit [Marinisporobacter balticus]
MCTQQSDSNFMDQYFEFQKNMLHTWQKSFMPNREEKNTDPITEKNPMDFFNQWTNASYDAFSKNINFMKENTASHGMLGALETYQNLYKFWNNLILENDKAPLDKFYSHWQKEYTKMLSNHFMNFLPDSVQNLLKDPIDTYQMYLNTSKNFYTPWLNNFSASQSLLGKSFTGDQDAFLDYVKLYRKNYEKTFGKFFDIPALGLGKEHFENEMNRADAFISYTNTVNEFFVTIYKVGTETMEHIMKEYQSMLTKGTHPKTFKEFYEYWWQENEAAYTNLFKTDDFSKLLSQVVDAGLILKQNTDKFFEEQLDFLPFPKMSDMKSLYKTVYDLKKEIKNLNKEMKNLAKNNNTNEMGL